MFKKNEYWCNSVAIAAAGKLQFVANQACLYWKLACPQRGAAHFLSSMQLSCPYALTRVSLVVSQSFNINQFFQSRWVNFDHLTNSLK